MEIIFGSTILLPILCAISQVRLCNSWVCVQRAYHIHSYLEAICIDGGHTRTPNEQLTHGILFRIWLECAPITFITYFMQHEFELKINLIKAYWGLVGSVSGLTRAHMNSGVLGLGVWKKLSFVHWQEKSFRFDWGDKCMYMQWESIECKFVIPLNTHNYMQIHNFLIIVIRFFIFLVLENTVEMYTPKYEIWMQAWIHRSLFVCA